MLKPWLGSLALPAAAVIVVVSRIKINVTDADGGSLSWSNPFSRITHKPPGRDRHIFLDLGLSIALPLMEMNMSAALGKLPGSCSDVGTAWIADAAPTRSSTRKSG
ncbi:hypothetical protein ACWD04_01935 [Streptomyces sp. NPDC002911]